MSDEPGQLHLLPGPPSDAVTGLIPAVEALLFAAGEPVTAGAMAEALQVDDPLLVAEAARRLAEQLQRRSAGLVVHEVAGGFQLRTHARFADPVLALRGGRPQKLSRPALEVLSVIAYQQPATRQDVEAVRGVSSGAVIKGLIERGLVKVTGRSDIPGRPLEYGTTPHFLEVFGLPDLRALPTLAEREAMEDEDAP